MLPASRAAALGPLPAGLAASYAWPRLAPPPAAALAAALPPPALEELCGVVLGKLEGGGLKQEAARTYMQALGAIA